MRSLEHRGGKARGRIDKTASASSGSWRSRPIGRAGAEAAGSSRGYRQLRLRHVDRSSRGGREPLGRRRAAETSRQHLRSHRRNIQCHSAGGDRRRLARRQIAAIARRPVTAEQRYARGTNRRISRSICTDFSGPVSGVRGEHRLIPDDSGHNQPIHRYCGFEERLSRYGACTHLKCSTSTDKPATACRSRLGKPAVIQMVANPECCVSRPMGPDDRQGPSVYTPAMESTQALRSVLMPCSGNSPLGGTA